jgi:hypothetical protein
MLLVPRQLRRAGMTGDVPYYGGRFTPAQAYAASHRRSTPPPPAGRTAVPPPPSAPPRPPALRSRDTSAALKDLLDSGVVTPEEYERLLARTRP